MTDAVEKAAIALFEHTYGGFGDCHRDLDWRTQAPRLREQAAVVIAALRDPTPAMLARMGSVTRAQWPAVVDAALGAPREGAEAA